MKYWIAINEHTCARSAIPMEPFPDVSPKPQMLLGFPTHDEALAAQHKCLTAPVEDVRAYLVGLTERQDVAKRSYKNAEPPVPGGVTAWMPNVGVATSKERAAIRRAFRRQQRKGGND